MKKRFWRIHLTVHNVETGGPPFPAVAPARTLAETREEWDAIAEGWAAARRKPWAEVLEFVRGLSAGARVLDLACGAGRHAIPLAADGREVHGLDLSMAQLRILKERARDGRAIVRAVLGSAASLPYGDASFEHAIFVAGLHHLPTAGHRLQALRELRRVLVPGGTCLVTVWARWQPRFALRMVRDLVLLPGRKLADRRYSFGDADVPWPQGGEAKPRFYHLYSTRELATATKRAGFFIRDLWSASLAGGRFDDNHLVVLQRPREPGA